MGALWSEQNKFQKWLDVEIAVCEVHAEMGTIPRDTLEQIKARANFSVDRINEIEKTTDHDVIAFTTNLAELIGEASRFVHYGLTSSDVVDTANALLLRDACDILRKKIDAFLEVLKRRMNGARIRRCKTLKPRFSVCATSSVARACEISIPPAKNEREPRRFRGTLWW